MCGSLGSDREAMLAAVQEFDSLGREEFLRRYRFEEYANILLYARAVQWDFGTGVLHFIPAGRQDAAYGNLVTSFDWRAFYEELGGGIFLEAVKRLLRNILRLRPHRQPHRCR